MKNRILGNLLHQYMNGFVSIAMGTGLRVDTNRSVSKKSYPFIPHSYTKLCSTLTEIEKHLYRRGLGHTPTFLDAGCGIGNIMLLAYEIGFDVSGIDLNPDLIEMAHHLLNGLRPEPELDIANILSYNKYNTFDVIYYFHPLCDYAMEKEFEKKVENEAKVGAIIVSAMKGDYAILKDKRFRRRESLQSKPSDIKVFEKVCVSV